MRVSVRGAMPLPRTAFASEMMQQRDARDILIRARRDIGGAWNVRVIEVSARVCAHCMLIDAFNEYRRAFRQVVVQLRAQLMPLRIERADRRRDAGPGVRICRADVERGREVIEAVHLEVVELPRFPRATRRLRRTGEIRIRSRIVDIDVRIREPHQRIRECVIHANADVLLRRCIERVVSGDRAGRIGIACVIDLQIRRADR